METKIRKSTIKFLFAAKFLFTKNFIMARVASYLTPDAQSDYALLAFPEKLWRIVNNPKREEVHWNALGTGIVIPNIQRFISGVLNNPLRGIFKTKNFASFVRQLNLYGFRKVTEYGRRATSSSPFSLLSKCEFKHPYFQKGRQDLLVHVKRHLCSSKKPDNRHPKNCPTSSAERQLNQLPACTSVNALRNPTLYTPVPFVPLQTSLQIPFTLYTPFYNAYQLAQMQHGPVVGPPNTHGLGSVAGHFPSSSPSPACTLAQGLGYSGQNTKLVSSASIGTEKMLAGIVSSGGNLPVENVESTTTPLSPSAIKSTATAVPVLTTNTVIYSNTSNPTPDVLNESKETNNDLTQGQAHVRRAYDIKLASPADKKHISTQTSTHSLSRELAKSSGSSWQSFTVQEILKESAVQRFVPRSQSLMPGENGENLSRNGCIKSHHGLMCNENVLASGTELTRKFTDM